MNDYPAFRVAVLAFIDFRELVLGGSVPAALFLALDSLALVAIVRHKAWFDRDREAPARRTARAVVGRGPDDTIADPDDGDPRPGRG